MVEFLRKFDRVLFLYAAVKGWEERGRENRERERESYLVSWCFEPCQPQRITSGLKERERERERERELKEKV